MHFFLSDDVFPVWVLRLGSLFVLLFILSMYVYFPLCTGVLCMCVCMHVCVCMYVCVCVQMQVCACRIYSQRRLISPAGPVRLFLGALGSQLEATAVTCLPNISPLFSSPLLSFLLLTLMSVIISVNYASPCNTQIHCGATFYKAAKLKVIWSLKIGNKITPKRLQTLMFALWVQELYF